MSEYGAVSSPQPPSVPPSGWGEAYGAVILAAGMSSRMGANKLLLPWRDGQPIVAHVAGMYARAGLADVVVVTGRDAERVCDAVSEFGLRCLHNPDYPTGEMLSSLKAGLSALRAGLAGAFVQPADMPCVPADVLALLMARHEAGWSLAPRYRGQRGHPVLLDRANWWGMLALPAGAAPRDGLGRVRLVDVEDEGVVVDVDSREVYEGLVGREDNRVKLERR